MILRDWKRILITGFLLGIIALIFVQFLEFQELRADRLKWLFDDPVFKILPRKDVSVAIFSLTYGSLICYFIICRKKNYMLSSLFIVYGLILLFRIVTLTILPLKEPVDMVFLHDPFLNELIYQSKIDADLFFSGHTALMVGIYYLSGKNVIFLFSAIAVGVLLMVQRVHYSIDILAAYPFAYLAYRSAQYIQSNWTIGDK
jgi:hypothetical protein